MPARHVLCRHRVAALLARLGARPRRITSDSRAVEPGVAFAAYPGARARWSHVHSRRGAARCGGGALGSARTSTGIRRSTCANQPVEGLKQNLGPIADFIYGSPSHALWTIGVTGTNGKTSCTHWIAQAFERFGRSAAVIGTLGQRLRRCARAERRTRRPMRRCCTRRSRGCSAAARRSSRWKCRRSASSRIASTA